MPSRWLPPLLRSVSSSKKKPRWQPGIEPLEDRVTPVVSATQNGAGVLTVTLSEASDAATITGTAASGDAIDVEGTGFTKQPFTGVTAINVIDSGANTGLAATFNDAGAGTAIKVTGAITVSGVETVNLATANGAIEAGSLNIAGATSKINLDTSVTTTGLNGQSYGGPVEIGATTATLEAGGGSVTFTSTIDAEDAGMNALVVNSTGTTSFAGLIGQSKALESVTTNAGGTTQIGSNVTTASGQSYNDPVLISGSTVVISSSSTGNITFGGTVNAQTAGATALTINTSGTTTFTGAVGGTAALSSLVTDPAGTASLGGNVTTVGAQSIGEPLTLTAAAIKLAATGNGNILLNSTVDGATALTVNTAGTTTFGGNVGGNTALLSIITDAAGSLVFGSGSASLAVRTEGEQTFNDPTRLNTTNATFTSTNNGNITFGGTLNGTTAGVNNLEVNTGGDTTFTGAVGGTTALGAIGTDKAGQTGEETIIGASVTTTGDQGYDDAVTITPGTGVTAITISSSSGGITFGDTLGGASAVPVTVQAGVNLGFNGNVTFTAAGSQFTAHTGTAGIGVFVIAPGLTFRADTQVWQSGNGPGGLTSSVADLVTNSPSFRDSGGTSRPVAFVFRQDAAITDASLPSLDQFRDPPPPMSLDQGAPPSYSIISDDGALTLMSAIISGPFSSNITLAAAQTVTLGVPVGSQFATVRLRSSNADVIQTANGRIDTAKLAVRAATGINLTAADNRLASHLATLNGNDGTFAAQTTDGNIAFRSVSPYTVGTVGSDPLALVFPTLSGISAKGTVDLSAKDDTALDVYIAAPVTGSTVTATGNSKDDRILVNYSLGATLPNGMTFNGGDGSDSFILTDIGGDKAHTYLLDGTITRDGASKLTYAGVESISVTGGIIGDTFTVTPDATAAITVAGGQPAPGPTTGDKLTLNLSGATNPKFSTSQAADGLQGTVTFDNRQPVAFSQMESLSPQADIRVTQSAPAFIGLGETATITITVTNLGTEAATGVTVTDLFPAGLAATWTATASTGASVAAASGTGNINTTVDLPVNGTVTFTVTLTASTTAAGTVTNTVTAGDSETGFDPNPANNTASANITIGTIGLTAAGAGPGGGPQVRVFNSDGTERFSFFAFEPSYTGGVTVATGDVTGDGFEDIIAGSASGAAHVKVFDGRTGAEIASFFAFPGFTGGVNVAVAGGQVIAGAGVGGGPIVKGFTVTGGVTETFSFFAYDGGFRGGVRVAGSDDLLAVGAGPGGGPHVKIFDIDDLTQRASFFAFPAGTADGVNVAFGTQNGQPTLIAGAGLDSPPTVVTLDALTGTVLGSLTAFDGGFTGGVRVATGIGADGRETLVVGAGPGGAPRVRFLAPDRSVTNDFFAFDASFRGGVFVG